jgi:hypothetical protein
VHATELREAWVRNQQRSTLSTATGLGGRGVTLAASLLVSWTSVGW